AAPGGGAAAGQPATAAAGPPTGSVSAAGALARRSALAGSCAGALAARAGGVVSAGADDHAAVAHSLRAIVDAADELAPAEHAGDRDDEDLGAPHHTPPKVNAPPDGSGRASNDTVRRLGARAVRSVDGDDVATRYAPTPMPTMPSPTPTFAI